MTDHDALSRAIVENPAEDTPRLIFADWLDENAGAFPTPAIARGRAAFIRDDIAASQREEFDPLRLRWELIEKPAREAEGWVKEVLPPLPAGIAFLREPLFRRGFPDGVLLESRDRRTVPDPPVSSFPLARVSFTACASIGVELLRHASWRGRLGTVVFDRGGRTSPTDLNRLFALGGFTHLERLAFLWHSIDRREIGGLIRWPLFASLTALAITGAPVGAVFAETLARGASCELRELQLVGCRVTPAAVEALLESSAANKLQSLSLGGDRIGAPEKFRALGRIATPPPIRALDMNEDAPNEAGLEAFLASPLVPGLQKLSLARCALNRDRARLLAGGKFDSLRVLNLGGNAVGNDGTAAIARSPHLAGLLVLDLSFSQVGDEGVEAILESPLADGLVLLDLRGSPASEEAKESLAARMGDRVRL